MCHSNSRREKVAVPRRRFLSLACTGVLSATLIRSDPLLAAEGIAQPDRPQDEAFIARAFEMRRLAVGYGDQPYGAVVVLDGLIIGQSWSRVVMDHDPTAHAEMSAIRDAARRLRGRELAGAILYSSSRPCAMCEAAAAWAGISEMIFGRAVTRAGRPLLCR